MSYAVVNVPSRAMGLGGGCQHDIDCPADSPYCCGGSCVATLEDPTCFPPSTAGCLNDDDCPTGVCCNGNCVTDASDPACKNIIPAGCPPYSTYYAPTGVCQCGFDAATGVRRQPVPAKNAWGFVCQLPGTPAPPPGGTTPPTPKQPPAPAPAPSPVPSSSPTTNASMSGMILPGLLIAGGLATAALLAKRPRRT